MEKASEVSNGVMGLEGGKPEILSTAYGTLVVLKPRVRMRLKDAALGK